MECCTHTPATCLLQEFTSDLHSRAVERIDNASTIAISQFKEDAGAMAHPIRPDSYIAMDNFYTITVYGGWVEHCEV